MISFTLFKKNIMSNIWLLTVFIITLGLCTGIIIWMFNPELNELLKQYQNTIPKVTKAMNITSDGEGTLIEFINTYLYSFLMIFFPMIFEIILVNKLIVRYVDNGSMAYLLATPNSRRKIITTQIISCILLTILLIGIITGIGCICSDIMFSEDLDIEKYVLLNLTTLLLTLAVSSICILTACFCNKTKSYVAVGAGIPILFYLIQMFLNMNKDLEKLKYATIFTLLPGKQIIEGAEDEIVMYSLILGIITIALYILSEIKFIKKDLSL